MKKYKLAFTTDLWRTMVYYVPALLAFLIWFISVFLKGFSCACLPNTLCYCGNPLFMALLGGVLMFALWVLLVFVTAFIVRTAERLLQRSIEVKEEKK